MKERPIIFSGEMVPGQFQMEVAPSLAQTACAHSARNHGRARGAIAGDQPS
ncbi:MAG: hypothetical protein KGI54_13745 [Pseudomonadota bacterium]|nr:hypothetical protein [Pseudomonadota bacterium]